MNIISTIPKEIRTAVAGATMSGLSCAALQLFSSRIFYNSRDILQNFVLYGLGATAIAGVVMTVVSTARFATRLLETEPSVYKGSIKTLSGVLSESALNSVAIYFWDIAPRFYRHQGPAVIRAFALNFAWAATGVAACGAFVFTIFATYHLGKLIINQLA